MEIPSFLKFEKNNTTFIFNSGTTIIFKIIYTLDNYKYVYLQDSDLFPLDIILEKLKRSQFYNELDLCFGEKAGESPFYLGSKTCIFGFTSNFTMNIYIQINNSVIPQLLIRFIKFFCEKIYCLSISQLAAYKYVDVNISNDFIINENNRFIKMCLPQRLS